MYVRTLKSQEKKNKKDLIFWGFEPAPSPYEADALTTTPRQHWILTPIHKSCRFQSPSDPKCEQITSLCSGENGGSLKPSISEIDGHLTSQERKMSKIDEIFSFFEAVFWA